ncbi:ATP-binding protein [Actinomycetospora lutea]|uniref:ATP-binding protein n=1 Tax=Actinomycetospora lutea TaxID=663604 RepID=UPI00236520D6|nr:ATP-binding protein [Actinomycetospora lutea]MDD7942421.1 ATP-binding protein [Actinomycetospora lutea]
MIGFPAVAEAVALVALGGITADEPPADAFAALWSWLADSEEESPPRRLVDGFGLARPDQALVTLLLAAETSEAVARAVATASASSGGVPGGGLPLWLACRAVPGLDAGALAATRPLTWFGLVRTDGTAPRIETRLTLAPAVVDRLLGHAVAEPAIGARMGRVPDSQPEARLVAALGGALATRGPLGPPPLVVAPGGTVGELGAALHALGLDAWQLDAGTLPDDPVERERLAVVWSREAGLDGAALIVHGTPPSVAALSAFLDRVVGHVLLVAERAPDGVARGVHGLSRVEDDLDTARRRWAAALGPDRTGRIGAGLTRVAAQFRLDPAALDAAVTAAAPGIDAARGEHAATAVLWHAAARAGTPVPLAGVRIAEPAHRWADLVLPPSTAAALHRIEVHVRHAARVFDDWGFPSRRGRGVAALFAGPSGTGKTMAAEVLADSLDLRVMTIDLSLLISKWVGETSKNIAACFAEAERSGAVMVWNEGDAVWGARGGVGNAVDRHINAEVGDLLQRIEEFSGFTVVTTNLRHAIDAAFLRRFRFVVDFPLPARDERRRLWAAAFPPAVPVDVPDRGALADLPLSGGSIRNVALGAAFLAAEAGVAVTPAMIEMELAHELRKQDLPVPRLTWTTDAVGSTS